LSDSVKVGGAHNFVAHESHMVGALLVGNKKQDICHTAIITYRTRAARQLLGDRGILSSPCEKNW
jgi:hypothetical protein